MQEILDQIITPEVRMVIYLMCYLRRVMLYNPFHHLRIRDAQRRAQSLVDVGQLFLLFLLRLLAYVILRPATSLTVRSRT